MRQPILTNLTQHAINRQQYDDKAEAYLNSQVHAEGAEFAKMRALLSEQGANNVLDLGCGGGHVSYQIAPVVKQVTAYDLSPAMVDNVIAHATTLGLTNINARVGCAEQLSFAEGQFEAIISRYSAHHWQSVPQALQEMHRVVRKDGKVIIFDILGHSHPIINNFLQTIETIRDPSHVRDYNLAEWTTMAEMAGFRIQTIEKGTLTLDFASWVKRMNTPTEAVATIRQLQQTASEMVKRYFAIQADGSFTTETLYLVLTKT